MGSVDESPEEFTILVTGFAVGALLASIPIPISSPISISITFAFMYRSI